MGQLSWVGGQTRSDFSFEVCQLSSCFNHSTINNIIKDNKLLRKAQPERAFFKFGIPGKKENF